MLRLLTLLTAIISFATFSAPKSELWQYWDASNEASLQTIDHQSWQAFLDKYVVVEGEHHLVNYKGISSEDKRELERYVRTLSSLDPRNYSRAEQYAYWVNLYNAITVDLILDSYPVKSITKLGGLFSFGPWGDEVTRINGKALTLNDIEHRILRPIWDEPRTHYAVNCASLGCPNLQTNAFTAKNTQALLEQAAKEFIISSKGVSFNQGKLTLSEIYDWFAVDFGTQEQLFEHLAQYRTEVKGYRGKVSYEYDWSLNETK
ncbi:DUF547 domain-containing protein [Vibrio astriarenae]|uniref:DUF547 domain-containing protein n=1 Tax=Vibrio astriarenae TaxID=1481923 RepID=A0A7Z2T1B1_9VIBR|nr:DUF547 domain-containing protein [Vibrio astriarenae]QIA62440.1 DUF547 domain-containing protein [Vibrio astriarenae]